MESANQNQEQTHDLPLIIVIKGNSSSQKREIGTSLGKFLHYPLIDEDDITLALQSSLSISSTTSENALAFNVIRQITKTQLQLKLQFVINLSFYQDNYTQSLLELAISQKAGLIIVECTGEGGSHNQVHDHTVEPARFLTIDMSEPFIVQDFVPTLTNAVKSLKDVLAQEISDRSLVSTSRASLPDHHKVPKKIIGQAHAHEFSFITGPKINSAGKLLACNCCENSISGPTYQCVVCDDFVLHKSCAEEVVPKLTAIVRYAPFYQLSHPPEYNFREEYSCKFCDQYFSSCNHCLLQTHIKSRLLPTVLQYEDHIHPLSFVIMPFWFHYEYKCIACDKYGESISYKCYKCYVDLHITCAIPVLHDVGATGPIVALGPWGGWYGFEWDDGIFSTVRQIGETSYCKLIIEYDDKGDSKWSSVPPDSLRVYREKVKLDYPDEYLTSIQGYSRPSGSGGLEQVCSLTFQSNKRTYGPFGDPGGTYFSSSNIQGHKIVGFYGKCFLTKFGVRVVHAIGIYLKPV